MPTVTMQTREREVVKTVTEQEEFVSVELSLDEAKILKAVIGSISNTSGKVVDLIADLYWELGNVTPGIYHLLDSTGTRVQGLNGNGASETKKSGV